MPNLVWFERIPEPMKKQNFEILFDLEFTYTGQTAYQIGFDLYNFLTR